MPLSIDDILAARRRIASEIYFSPCPESIPLSELCGAKIYCKLEYLQRTGSFKERGARNALLVRGQHKRLSGVIAASAGNHALGLAYHGKLLGIPVTVVMPRFAPLIKVTNCRRLGAQVELFGESLADARGRAEQLAAERSLEYFPGFDDPDIVCGQGTVGLELLEQVPELDAVVISVGGGGLIAGVALAVKALKPTVQIIGVQPVNAACFPAALAAGQPLDIQLQPTLADGLAVTCAGKLPLEICRTLVDRWVKVDEQQLSLAVLRLVEMEKSVVEGAGAATLAALTSGQLPELSGQRVALVLSGGNIDPIVLSRVIEKGLVADNRLWQFAASISDRPGGLARLASVLAEAGASVKDIAHDRTFSGPSINAVNVLCTVEAADGQHIAAIRACLVKAGVHLLDVAAARQTQPA